MRSVFLLIFALLNLVASNLSEIINLAQSSNLAQISELNTQISELKHQSTKSAYMPSLSLSGGYSHHLTQPSILTPKKSLSIIATIEILLYDGGKREASLAALRHASSSEILKNEDFKNSLALTACKLYFNATALNEIIRAKTAEIGYLQSALNRAEKFYQAGLFATDEVEAIRAKFESAKVAKLELMQKLNEILGQINLLTNQSVAPKPGSKIDEISFSKEAEAVHLKALQEEVMASKKEAEAASSNMLPSVFIRNNNGFYRNDFRNDFSSLDPRFQAVTPYLDTIFKKRHKSSEILLGFSWKIFDFGSALKQKELKQIASLQASLNLRQKRLENSIKLENLKNELKILKQKIKANEVALNAANSLYDAVWKKYDAGILGYVEFLQALGMKFEAQSALELSRDEFEIKKAEFLYENGEEILKRVVDE